jgi:hypothetical protein
VITVTGMQIIDRKYSQLYRVLRILSEADAGDPQYQLSQYTFLFVITDLK